MRPEIEPRGGGWRWFRAEPEEVEEVFASIPDAQLVEEWERPWTSRGLEAPETTVKELRERALEAFRAFADQPPKERVLTVVEAARALGMGERELRYQVDQGRHDAALVVMPNGTRGLRFQESPHREWWPLLGILPPRPDPRVVWNMAKARVQPGESFEFEIQGSGRVQTCRRRADGECWREVSRW